MKKPRFHVAPCDNCGSVEGLKRDRTWDVIDRKTGGVLHSCTTRKEARQEAQKFNEALDVRSDSAARQDDHEEAR